MCFRLENDCRRRRQRFSGRNEAVVADDWAFPGEEGVLTDYLYASSLYDIKSLKRKAYKNNFRFLYSFFPHLGDSVCPLLNR